MNTIDVTGPGTYSVDGCYADGGGVSLVYASTNPDNNSCAESGTITFTEYNTSAGGHMTGTMSVNTKTMLSPYVTGTVTATFDLVTGSSNGI